MPFLTPDETAALEAQRFDAPIRSAVERAMLSLGVDAGPAMLDQANRSGFDVQARSAFLLCKPLKLAPAEAGATLARALASELGAIGSCEASPGTAFVNIRISQHWAMDRLRDMGNIFPILPSVSAIVDYSSPNCAKRMHVGHLRSTVIGDALCRLIEACGGVVERVNHLGDWGTPFGVIIEQALDEGLDLSRLGLNEIEEVYKRGSARFSAAESTEPVGDDDQAKAAWISTRTDGQSFAQRARATTSAMQAGEGPERQRWESIRSSTLSELQQTYELLAIGLRPEHAIGESFYQGQIGPILDDLLARKITTRTDMGVAFIGGKIPLGLEKSPARGGGYLYGGTDAAALKKRAATGQRLLYVTDERQADHFASLFELGTQAGWTAPGQAIHVPFGMMLDKTGKPFKSRSGSVVALSELVEMAIDEARVAILERVPGMNEKEVELFARPIGVGALKYGDLSRSRTSAVKFDLKAAASLDGDTGPHMQYARARAVSAAKAAARLPPSERSLVSEHPSEKALIVAMGKMRDGAIDALAGLEPHRLCHAVSEAASAFGSFYEHCPCAHDGSADSLRLELMERFASSLSLALSCLGVEPLESMPRAPKPVTPSRLTI